jgi:NlpC/P60 family putative phage cell wall peptidase
VIADEAVAEARGWLGTPYLHQASFKGVGADCLGLIRGVWRAVYGQEPEAVPVYTPDWAEPAGDEVLWRGAARHLSVKPAGAAAVGDVLLFRMGSRSVAKHLGIAARIGAEASFMHAYSRHGVVESPLSTPWARRIVARFEFPERGV